MIIFVLTYAVLALLGLSIVGSLSFQIHKPGEPSAKARSQPMSLTSRAVPRDFGHTLLVRRSP